MKVLPLQNNYYGRELNFLASRSVVSWGVCTNWEKGVTYKRIAVKCSGKGKGNCEVTVTVNCRPFPYLAVSFSLLSIYSLIGLFPYLLLSSFFILYINISIKK